MASWIRKAADQGDARAQYGVAVFYYAGNGVPQDYVAGAKFLRKAADQGNADAQKMLGSMYFLGRGVPKDYVSAHMWYNLSAAANGNEEVAKLRDTTARLMTPSQVAEAQKLAREWKPTPASR